MDANSPPAHGLPNRRRRAFLWGVASTALSAAGLIAFALFEQYNAGVTELRTDLKRFNETSADYVKRDQLARLREHMIQLSRDVAAANATRLALERELQASERSREEQAKELQRTRERLAYLEGLGAAKAVAPAAPEPPH
jgi:septal ring factor EnvC (AmiA/AmiB activator)